MSSYIKVKELEVESSLGAFISFEIECFELVCVLFCATDTQRSQGADDKGAAFGFQLVYIIQFFVIAFVAEAKLVS